MAIFIVTYGYGWHLYSALCRGRWQEVDTRKNLVLETLNSTNQRFIEIGTPPPPGPAPWGDAFIDVLVCPAGCTPRETTPQTLWWPRRADVSTHADSSAGLNDTLVSPNSAVCVNRVTPPSQHKASCLVGREKCRPGNRKWAFHGVWGDRCTSQTSHLILFNFKETKTYSLLCVQKRKGSR